MKTGTIYNARVIHINPNYHQLSIYFGLRPLRSHRDWPGGDFPMGENRYHLPNHPWKSSKSPIFKAIGYKYPSDLPMKMEEL